MRFRIIKGFNSVISVPGMTVETARVHTDTQSIDLTVTDGTITIAHTDLAEVKSETNRLDCEIEINGDRYPLQIIIDARKPSRR